MNLVKKLGVAVVVLVISSVVFYIFVQDQQFKQDLLRTTLSAFGDQLLAMVPTGQEKAGLEKKYQEFIHQADRDNIPEENIERVAAAILNLSNQDTVISAQEAIALLDLNTTAGAPLPAEPPHDRHIIRLDRVESSPEIRQIRDRDQLAKKLSQMRELDFQINCLSPQVPTRNKIVFTADSGLRVTLSTELKAAINSKADPMLEMHLRNLEKQKLLAWRIKIPDSILSNVSNYFAYIPRDLQNQIPVEAKNVLSLLSAVNIDSLARSNPDSLKNYLKIQFQIK